MIKTIKSLFFASGESREELKRVANENKVAMNLYKAKKKRKFIPESEYITQMEDSNNVIEFDNLHTYFYTDTGTVKAVSGVTFSIPKGTTVGVVGESGCGKSVTSLSLMRLIQEPSGQIVNGSIRYNTGDKVFDLAKAPISKMQELRGNKIGMIFQEPMTSLNPVFTIGSQIDETMLLHYPNTTKEQAKAKSIEMLNIVGISRPEGIYDSYPHELSGGMRQRVMIAMALICEPNLIVADEPTTALDVTIQAQILDLLRDLKSKVNASIMLITHDLGVIAEMAETVVVMYAGRVIEQGTLDEIFREPKHPYTKGLLLSKPSGDGVKKKLYSIPGNVPNPIDMPNTCHFKDRCEFAVDACSGVYPPITQTSPTQKVACWLYNDGEKDGK
ncbi:ABC transporter ATP-binding protein [Thiospirochaeta perfilievii]|uniref:ABC transporter ATP-binding protein n=1 Tax=Thiospirochaeta perfilievii TaxID=252967 RepID=A0A5C1QCQ3_9SPIO|nr:ABC transporter ATP-binding protein [Thiospirochaeta perfilievii]QEN05883.1 ABC transporter ATP-binding protein [Thiospirochaeta perfilievii]